MDALLNARRLDPRSMVRQLPTPNAGGVGVPGAGMSHRDEGGVQSTRPGVLAAEGEGVGSVSKGLRVQAQVAQAPDCGASEVGRTEVADPARAGVRANAVESPLGSGKRELNQAEAERVPVDDTTRAVPDRRWRREQG
ncbi:hypothetical protein FHG89_00965 [Micromonospora orduensis]|uniref:Uncharacterized protein n=1 Tax=Micromonospora orduensis TaxID=1420891 RepID=A0A5C4R0U3_9ACTN|nr:hypothetical protein FHG89_00965 [Micromonospora orduensis]